MSIAILATVPFFLFGCGGDDDNGGGNSDYKLVNSTRDCLKNNPDCPNAWACTASVAADFPDEVNDCANDANCAQEYYDALKYVDDNCSGSDDNNSGDGDGDSGDGDSGSRLPPWEDLPDGWKLPDGWWELPDGWWNDFPIIPDDDDSDSDDGPDIKIPDDIGNWTIPVIPIPEGPIPPGPGPMPGPDDFDEPILDEPIPQF